MMSYKTTSSYSTGSQGFTLIELMISLVLGLLISAAVIQVYIISTRTATVQQSASEVQDSTIFSLQSLEDHIRIANLGNPITSINDSSNHGGIVLTQANLGSAGPAETSLFTNGTDSAGWTGLSNINAIASDQITIQYKNITDNALYDCEGEKVEDDNEWVVERYFIRLASGAPSKSGVQDLVLACAAGRVDKDGAVTKPFTGNGEVIITAIDQFKMLLGVQTDVTKLTYLTPKDYLALTPKPAITTIKLGVIVRSNTPLITDTDKELFTIFGADHTLKADATRQNYYRRSYESTVLLRNARVMSFVSSANSIVQ